MPLVPLTLAKPSLELNTRQIVNGKTNDIENDDNTRFLKIRQLMKKQFDTHQ